jgi:hypothetical protein
VASTSNKKAKTIGPTDVEKTIEATAHQLLFQFVNNAGLPDITVKNEDLRELIDFLIKNSRNLKNYRHLGRYKFASIRLSTFKEFVGFVSGLVSKIEKWYIENTVSTGVSLLFTGTSADLSKFHVFTKGASQEFVVVAHDVWDGKRKKILGLTIFITDPETFITYRIPVALVPPTNETALTLAEESLASLDQYGIVFALIWRAVNDNCSTAMKAGRL